jgi:hypothetical protein
MIKYFLISIGLILFSSVLQAAELITGINIRSQHIELMLYFLSYLILFVGMIRYDVILTSYFSKFDLALIGLMLFWFIINIIRSIDIPLSNLSTLPRFLGGRFYTAALLVPFFVFLGSNIHIIKSSWELSKASLYVFLIFSPLLFVYNVGILMAFVGLLPIMILNYDKLSKREVFLVATVLAVRLLFSLVHGARNEFVRLSFYLIVALLIVNRNVFKNTLRINILGIILIFFLFASFLYVYSGNLSKYFTDPEIVESIKSFEKDNLNTKSREMVYDDFVDDFDNWKDIVFGRGALGTTFSPQYIILQEITGTKENVFKFPPGYRLEVESGYLQIVLKTGLIGLILFVLISFRAMYFGIFKSKNTFTMMVSIIILERFPSMISFGLPEYSLDYILFWLSVGVCLSEKIRSISNVEIYFFLKSSKYYRPKFVTLPNVPEQAQIVK